MYTIYTYKCMVLATLILHHQALLLLFFVPPKLVRDCPVQLLGAVRQKQHSLLWRYSLIRSLPLTIGSEELDFGIAKQTHIESNSNMSVIVRSSCRDSL
jgi:hypothetical protein